MYQHSADQNYAIKHINPYITAKWCIQVALASRMHIEILEQIRAEVRYLYSSSEDVVTSVLSEANAVFMLIMKHVRYTDDPHGVELMYHPVEMIRRWQRFGGRWVEDCESIAALTLTCLLALGRKARIAVVAYDPIVERSRQTGRPEIVAWPFLHIFAEVYIPGLKKPNGEPVWSMVDPSMGFRGRADVVAKDTKKIFYMYPSDLNTPIRWEVHDLIHGTIETGIDEGQPLSFPQQFNPGVLSAPSMRQVTQQEIAY